VNILSRLCFNSVDAARSDGGISEKLYRDPAVTTLKTRCSVFHKL